MLFIYSCRRMLCRQVDSLMLLVSLLLKTLRLWIGDAIFGIGAMSVGNIFRLLFPLTDSSVIFLVILYDAHFLTRCYRYADFLSRLNDDRNIRALFERALSSLPPEESVEVQHSESDWSLL